LWHWAFFTPTTPTASLGADGHPMLSSAALAPHPRRMFGAGSLEWTGNLDVGAVAQRVSAVRSTRATSGASGALLIVTLEHEYHQAGTVRLREQQTLVYRDPPADPVALPIDGPPPALPTGGWSEVRRPAPPLLFRFSAVTFNTHRIHYDLPYARDVEGYPGLVVHGPLTAITIASFVERSTQRRLATFGFKATAPMFADQPATVVAEPPDPTDGTGTAQMIRTDGVVAMQATYGLR
jgi:3-methylfumaryl-CoA hydratase